MHGASRIVVFVLLGLCVLAARAAAPSSQITPLDPSITGRTVTTFGPTDLKGIELGASHSCAYRYDGATVCWGRNEDGESGSERLEFCGSQACASRPQRVRMATGQLLVSTQLSVGANHSCSRDVAGLTSCWGKNQLGQAGIPSYSQVMQPQPVFNAPMFSQVSAGVESTCAVASTGVHCWGRLGNGTGSGSTWQAAPMPNGGGMQTVSAAESHICMQSSVAKELFCIGRNPKGQLTFDPVQAFHLLVPTLTMFGAPVGPARTRNDFVCVDRLTDGTVACAGANNSGQLGDGTRLTSFQPRLVGGGAKLSKVAVGWYHACALDPQGRAWCWGNGKRGQLGHGAIGESDMPVLVAGGTIRFRAVAAGMEHSCGIGTDNNIYCWGENTNAQLGIGNTNGGIFASPVLVSVRTWVW